MEKGDDIYSRSTREGHPMSTSSLSPDSAASNDYFTFLPSPYSVALHQEKQDDNMSSSPSDSNSEGSRSPSPLPSPDSQRQYPSLAFRDAINMPFKSRLSLPSTTSSEFSISPETPPSSLSSSSFTSCAYPDWPRRDSLAAIGSSFSGDQASSYISDEELLDLAELELCDNMRIPTGMSAYGAGAPTNFIPWEATKQPPVVLQSLPTARKGMPTPKRRRRSSPLKKRKMVLGMSPIPELTE